MVMLWPRSPATTRRDRSYEKKPGLNPSSELAYLRLASIALLLHQPATALADSESAVRVAPNSADAHYFLGRSYLEGSQTADAIGQLETARRLAPTSPKVRFNLARAYDRAHRTSEAEQERAEFVRLNAQMETKAHSGIARCVGRWEKGPCTRPRSSNPSSDFRGVDLVQTASSSGSATQREA